MPCRFVLETESAKTDSRVDVAVMSLFSVRNGTFEAAQISEPGGTMATYPRGTASTHFMRYRVSYLPPSCIVPALTSAPARDVGTATYSSWVLRERRVVCRGVTRWGVRKPGMIDVGDRCGEYGVHNRGVPGDGMLSVNCVTACDPSIA